MNSSVCFRISSCGCRWLTSLPMRTMKRRTPRDSQRSRYLRNSNEAARIFVGVNVKHVATERLEFQPWQFIELRGIAAADRQRNRGRLLHHDVLRPARNWCMCNYGTLVPQEGQEAYSWHDRVVSLYRAWVGRLYGSEARFNKHTVDLSRR